MKKLLLSATIALTTLPTLAQWTIPNNSLDNWAVQFGSFEDPVNWPSSNYLFVGGYANSFSVFKSTDAHAGTHAARLVSVPLNSNPLAGMMPDTVAIIVSGSINPLPSPKLHGIPFSANPAKLEFFAKYAPNGADTANIFVVLTKWNTAQSKQDTVGLGWVQIGQTVSTYTKFEASIIYPVSGIAPDSAMIMVASSGFNGPKENSELLVDAFAFTGGNVGYQEVSMGDFVPAHYPNPANESLTIPFQKEMNGTITVLDITGKQLFTQAHRGQKATLSLDGMAPGVYFYQLANQQGEHLVTGKFIVAGR